MQLTIQSILNNLVTVQSEELFRRHISDDRFSSVWNSFMICRYLSFTAYSIPLLCLFNDISETKDPALAYAALLAACRKAKPAGVASSYRPSPFID